MENPVRKTTRFVLENAKDVVIDHAEIEKIAREWAKKKIKAPLWQNPLHLSPHLPGIPRGSAAGMNKRRRNSSSGVQHPAGRWGDLSNTDEKTLLTYLFILDSLNFCFWAKDKIKKWHYLYKGKRYSGYFALAATLKAWFEKNPEKANFKYFSKISRKEFCEMFQGGKNLLFLTKRWKILRSVSRVFVRR